MKTSLVTRIALIFLLTFGWGVASAAPPPVKTGRVPVNGVSYYYEVRGEGEPLLLLHGGLMSGEMFRPILAELGEGRKVILVDLHGHGRTSLGKRHIDYAAQGDDLAILIKKLGFKKVDVVGYSMGGGIAFQLAVRHPERVRRLVMVSTPVAQDGFYPEMLPMQAAVGAAMFEQMKQTPMYTSYAAVAPHPEEFPTLLDEMGAWMRKPYDWRADVAKLTMPTMLVYGDSDMIRTDHAVELYKLLGGAKQDAGWQREHMATNRLAIIPDATHYDIFSSPLLVPTLRHFLR